MMFHKVKYKHLNILERKGGIDDAYTGCSNKVLLMLKYIRGFEVVILKVTDRFCLNLESFSAIAEHIYFFKDNFQNEPD